MSFYTIERQRIIVARINWVEYYRIQISYDRERR